MKLNAKYHKFIFFFVLDVWSVYLKNPFFKSYKKLFDKTGQNILHLITTINIIFVKGSILIGSD